MFFVDKDIIYKILTGTFTDVRGYEVDIILEIYKMGNIVNEFDVVKYYKENVDYKYKIWMDGDISEIIKPIPEEYDRFREFLYLFKLENDNYEKHYNYSKIYSMNDILMKYEENYNK